MNTKHNAASAERTAPTSDNAPWQGRVIAEQSKQYNCDSADCVDARKAVADGHLLSLRCVGDLLRQIGGC